MKLPSGTSLGAVLTVLALGVGDVLAFPTLNETFESYTAGQPLPEPPWLYVAGVAALDYSVVAGYTTNASNVFIMTDRQSAAGVEQTGLYAVNSGLLYFEFDIAHNGGQQVSKLYFRDASDRNILQVWIWPQGNASGLPMLNVNNTSSLIDVMTPGQWYHVKLTIDLDNDTVAGEVDGTPRFSALAISNYTLVKFGFTSYWASDFGSGATYWDNVKAQMQCFAKVDPTETQLFDLTADPAPLPPHEVPYTVDNVGLDAISYTIEEVDATGQPKDYDWLSLDKTGGSLASGQADTVTATIDYACSAVGDPSVNASAPLPSPWVGVTGEPAEDYRVVAGYTTNTSVVFRMTDRTSVPGVEREVFAPASGIASFEFDVAHDGGQQFQKMYFRSLSDVKMFDLMVRPEGSAEGMLSVNSEATLIGAMIPGQWYHVKLTINLDNDTIAGEVDGTTVFSDYSLGPGTDVPLQKVGFTSYYASDFGAGASYWDNLRLLPGPGLDEPFETHPLSTSLSYYLRIRSSCGQDELRRIDVQMNSVFGCRQPFADADGDRDVDQMDFALLQLCYTGSLGTIGTTSYCVCLDFGDDDSNGIPDLDGDIDAFDLAAFEACASGPGVPVTDPCCFSGQ